MTNHPSYHDLHITLPGMKRTPIFNLPFSVQVTCTRVGGWEVWNTYGSPDPKHWELLGSEYGGEKSLRLDVNGKVIVDSINA